MLWILPYLLAAEVGIWICVPASREVSLGTIGQIAAGLGLLTAGYSAWAQRIEQKLATLDRVQVGDSRVQSRLTDRLSSRRVRLVQKRVVIFCSGVAATVGGWIFAHSSDLDLQVLFTLLAVGGAFAAATGSTLLFVESSNLDERASELQRYAERLKKSADAAEQLRKARTPNPKAKVPAR